MTARKILELLEGNEILSLSLEGCVGILGGKVVHEGKVLKVSAGQIKKLFDEYFRQEIGSIKEAI